MFWPATEPGNATIALFTTFAIIAICVIPIFAFLFRCRWWKLALFSMLMAVLMLPASCSALWNEIDKARFGRFDYHQFEDVKDHRVERYLPPKATYISLHKHDSGNGYVARYRISEEDLLEYIDGLWEKDGQYAYRTKEETHRQSHNGLSSLERYDLILSLADPGQSPIASKIFYSPQMGNGAGATYYFIEETGEVFQTAGYF